MSQIQKTLADDDLLKSLARFSIGCSALRADIWPKRRKFSELVIQIPDEDLLCRMVAGLQTGDWRLGSDHHHHEHEAQRTVCAH